MLWHRLMYIQLVTGKYERCRCCYARTGDMFVPHYSSGGFHSSSLACHLPKAVSHTNGRIPWNTNNMTCLQKPTALHILETNGMAYIKLNAFGQDFPYSKLRTTPPSCTSPLRLRHAANRPFSPRRQVSAADSRGSSPDQACHRNTFQEIASI